MVWGIDLRNGEMLWHVAHIESKRGQGISSLLGGRNNESGVQGLGTMCL